MVERRGLHDHRADPPHKAARRLRAPVLEDAECQTRKRGERAVSLFQFYFLELTAVNILLAWAIYVVFRADQIYFGPMYTMCIGAYFAAYATRDLHVPFLLAMVGSVVLSV